MLCLSLQFNGWRFSNNTLYTHLNEFIETVELLSHKTLVVKIGVNYDPASLLPKLIRNFLIFFLIVINYFFYKGNFMKCRNSYNLIISLPSSLSYMIVVCSYYLCTYKIFNNFIISSIKLNFSSRLFLMCVALVKKSFQNKIKFENIF
jgi:hypothetical protein